MKATIFTYDIADVKSSPVLRDWLIYAGSFMQRLKTYEPKVSVLKQEWQDAQGDEKERLGINEPTLIREVVISSQKIHWMFARTVFPKSTLTGEQENLAHLQDRSLGSILFKDPTLTRSAFKYAKLEAGMALHDQMTRELNMNLPILWARRSLFHVQAKPLLLTEVFLPAIEGIPVPL